LALLPLGFALPRLLPAARWALTSPFHPCPTYLFACARGRRRRCVFCGTVRRRSDRSRWRPGVTWQRAQWSPDFPRTVFREYCSRPPGWRPYEKDNRL